MRQSVRNNNQPDPLTGFRWKIIGCAFMIIIVILFGVIIKLARVVDELTNTTRAQNKQIQDLNKRPIQNVISNKTCSSNFGKVTVQFYGISVTGMRICEQVQKKKKTCTDQTEEYLESAKQLLEPELENINGEQICQLRAEQSFARQLDQRQEVCPAPKKFCGSDYLLDKKYCLEECTPNEILISKDPSDPSGNRVLQSLPESYGKLNITMNYHNSWNNPIQEIYIGLSKPCGDPTQYYSVRENKIVGSFLLDKDTCTFDQFSSNKLKTDELYQFTGYQETELSLLLNNLELDEIGLPMPDEVKEVLSSNTVKIYYKTFNLWTIDCQAKYPAKSFINVVVNNYSNLLLANDYLVYAVTIFIFSVICYWFMYFLWFCWCNQWPGTSFSRIFLFLFYGIYMILNLSLLSSLINIHSIISEIDGDVIADISERQCSDGALQDTFDYMRMNQMTDGHTWIVQIYVIISILLVSFIIVEEIISLGYGIFKYIKYRQALKRQVAGQGLGNYGIVPQ